MKTIGSVEIESFEEFWEDFLAWWKEEQLEYEDFLKKCGSKFMDDKYTSTLHALKEYIEYFFDEDDDIGEIEESNSPIENSDDYSENSYP